MPSNVWEVSASARFWIDADSAEEADSIVTMLLDQLCFVRASIAASERTADLDRPVRAIAQGAPWSRRDHQDAYVHTEGASPSR